MKAKHQPVILVVDDEKGNRDFFRLVLSEWYQVQTASSGESGLARIRAQSPDIVLLDLKMPGMDGIEVLREIKKIDKNIVVVMLTAYGTMETARIAMRLGAYDYLTKPFDLEYVKAVLKDGLKSTVAGAVEELKKSNAVRQAARQKVKLERLGHCFDEHPCLWEIAIRSFVLGDDGYVLDWMEKPKFPEEQKLKLMELARMLKGK